MSASIRVKLGRSISFRQEDAGEAFIDALCTALSLENPIYQAALRRGGRPPYGIPKRICGVSRHGNVIRIPRGAMRELRAVAARHEFRLTVDDHRTWVEAGVAFPAVSLRAHQEEALARMLARQQGLNVTPAGGGKTRTAIAFIARSGARTLILVGMLDLAAQWRDQIRALLHVEPGFIGGGMCREAGPVVIVSPKSLASWAPDRLEKFLAGFGAIIVDEAHHSVATTWRTLIDGCPARYRIGLTATPSRSDGLDDLIRWSMGEVIYRGAHSELIHRGHLVAPKRVELVTEFTHDYRSSEDWHDLLEHLWNSSNRNALILDEIGRRAAEGHSVLVLTGRVAHAELLAAKLRGAGIAAESLTGATKKPDREGILEGAREGRIRVLCATNLADEGLDAPRLSCVVLCFPAKDPGRVEQRLGRIMRPHADKREALVIDVVDKRVGVLARQAERRALTFDSVVGRAPQDEPLFSGGAA